MAMISIENDIAKTIYHEITLKYIENKKSFSKRPVYYQYVCDYLTLHEKNRTFMFSFKLFLCQAFIAFFVKNQPATRNGVSQCLHRYEKVNFFMHKTIFIYATCST